MTRRPPAGAAARLHRSSERALTRVATGLGALHDGVWLGLSGPAVLHAIDEDYYRAERKFADADWNRRGLLAWETDMLDRYFTPASRIAVTGAGGGREVLALLRAGYEPDGFECNVTLVAAANRLLEAEGLAQRVTPVGRDQWPPGAATYDGLVVGWGSYMLVQTRERRVAFLAEAHDHLRAGAPALVSFFVRPGDTRYFRTVERTANRLRHLRRRPPVEVGDTVRPNYVHYFTEEEVAAELADAGFDLCHFAAEPYGHAVGRAR